MNKAQHINWFEQLYLHNSYNWRLVTIWPLRVNKVKDRNNK